VALYGRLKEDSDTSMGGLVLECFICGRLLIFPIHRPKYLEDWNKHGRVCLKCLLRWKFADAHLEGYIIESEVGGEMYEIYKNFGYPKKTGWKFGLLFATIITMFLILIGVSCVASIPIFVKEKIATFIKQIRQ